MDGYHVPATVPTNIYLLSSASQTAALLLALAPGWALVDAIIASRKRRSIIVMARKERKALCREERANRLRSPVSHNSPGHSTGDDTVPINAQTPEASALLPRRRGAHTRETSSTALLATPTPPESPELGSSWNSSNISISPPPDAFTMFNGSPSPRVRSDPSLDDSPVAGQGVIELTSTTLDDPVDTQISGPSAPNREAVAESWDDHGEMRRLTDGVAIVLRRLEAEANGVQ